MGWLIVSVLLAGYVIGRAHANHDWVKDLKQILNNLENKKSERTEEKENATHTKN